MNDHIPDATKMISDTPRTDENEFDWVTASFARKLERQLNAANERIKRMEEVGDALCENSNPSRWDSPADAARKLTEQSNWRKAKEAKP
jgi:hypothetical protein